ncbi:MAG: zf-HC2 domain-containing protein [Firmicutes bacterium]|nr:zf-HC2 domain-containing protein [Bacillota bacterium]
MKISCNTCRDLIPLYVDGAVSDDSAELIREHLLCCEECRKLMLTVKNEKKKRDPAAVSVSRPDYAFVAKRLVNRRNKLISAAASLTLLVGISAGYGLHTFINGGKKSTEINSKEN